MELPDGYKVPAMIAKLQRSLYGLKQSPRQWYAELNTFLLSLGYTRSLADEAFYHKKDCWILVYVDDLFIAGRLQEINHLKMTIAKQFRMKDLGEMSSFLGMQIIYDKKNQQIFLNQSEYFMRILEDFNMATCHAAPTPFVQGLQLEALPLDSNGDPEAVVDHDRYRTLIGSLLYGSTHTRPDISFALGVLSRYLHAPGKDHWSAAKHLLRYIRGTIQYGLLYKGTVKKTCYFHADADYAFQIAHRKSTTGYVSMLASAAIIWNSTLQRSVALSTMESEYIALSEAAKEALWLSKLFLELSQHGKLGGIPEVAVIYSDNDAAVILAKNPERHQKAKHIDIRYHHIRDEWEAGSIRLGRVDSKDNIADVLTKSLPRLIHHTATQMLGLRQIL